MAIKFSSAELPEYLSHRQRFNLWRDIYTSQFGLFDFAISDNLPFSASLEITPVGPLAIGRMRGTIERVARTAHEVALDSRDAYTLVINRGAEMSGKLARRDYRLAGGAAVLMANDDIGSMVRRAQGASDDWFNVVIPGALLRAAVGDVDDRVARGIAAQSETLSLLAGYGELLQNHGPIASPELLAHASHTLLDLVVLSLGASGEAAEQASARGLRGARLQAVLAQICQRFAEATLTTRDIAVALNISTRYVNDILHETGAGFSERVLELRLQRARVMLADRRCDGLRIGEIA